MTNWSQYSIGASPNTENDPLAWAAQSVTSPMPIYGTFKTWYTFVKTYNKNPKQ
jgi:hypothetical protein